MVDDGVIQSNLPWWRHQMETFSALLAICAGNSPVPGEFPAQRPVTRSFDVFFDLRLNKRLSKQSWGWWFKTLSPHYDVTVMYHRFLITVYQIRHDHGKQKIQIIIRLIKVTPHLTLMGDAVGVFRDYSGEKWPWYEEVRLPMPVARSCQWTANVTQKYVCRFVSSIRNFQDFFSVYRNHTLTIILLFLLFRDFSWHTKMCILAINVFQMSALVLYIQWFIVSSENEGICVVFL